MSKTYNGKNQAIVSCCIMTKLLAFVHIFVESPKMDQVVCALQGIPNIEEISHVTGEFDIVSLVSARDIEEFREILKNKIMKINGVKSTVSSVVLHKHVLPGMPKLAAVITA